MEKIQEFPGGMGTLPWMFRSLTGQKVLPSVNIWTAHTCVGVNVTTVIYDTAQNSSDIFNYQQSDAV